jgi:hypothetical protein
MALNPTNWITISFIMGVAWFHLHYLTKAYNNAMKDRAIIHAEVLYEYDNRVCVVDSSLKRPAHHLYSSVCIPSTQHRQEGRMCYDERSGDCALSAENLARHWLTYLPYASIFFSDTNQYSNYFTYESAVYNT